MLKEIKQDKTDIIVYAGLFFIAFFVCFKSCLNPFGLISIDTDTSIFLTIAQGITRGQVPFRDFYDNKGPLTYLISVPGFALGRFTGVWITEVIFMCISVFFAYKTALFFGSRFFAFIGVVLSFVVFQSFFYEVAGTEEYSMPFMMISLYIFTKYYLKTERVYFFELLIFGFCFASSILLRINMFSLWLGFCAVICVEAILKRDFTALVKDISGFCIGIGIITIPVLLYLKTNDAFFDYIRQNFIIGSSRGLSGFEFKEFVESFFTIAGKNLCFIPLLAAYVWIIKDFSGRKRYYYAGYVSAFIMTILFHAVIRESYDHYNMVLTPFLVPAFTFFVKEMYNYFSNIRYKRICFVVFLCIFFSTPLVFDLYRLYSTTKDQTRKNVMLTGKAVDEHTSRGDTILSLGNSCQIYLFTQRNPASKYIYQTSGVDYEPKAHEEFLRDIYTRKPAIIVVKNKDGHYDHLPAWYAPVYSMIENEYHMITDRNGYFLFKLKPRAE